MTQVIRQRDPQTYPEHHQLVCIKNDDIMYVAVVFCSFNRSIATAWASIECNNLEDAVERAPIHRFYFICIIQSELTFFLIEL